MLALLITEALAQRVNAPPPPAPVSYGDFPLIQAAFGLLIVIIGGIAAVKAAMREKNTGEKPAMREANTYVYADGPVAELLVQVKVVAEALKAFPAAIATLVSLKEQFSTELKETRHGIRNDLQEKMQEVDRDFEKRDRAHEELERRIREVENRQSRFEGQLQQRSH